jgi:hypothetical protein
MSSWTSDFVSVVHINLRRKWDGSGILAAAGCLTDGIGLVPARDQCVCYTAAPIHKRSGPQPCWKRYARTTLHDSPQILTMNEDSLHKMSLGAIKSDDCCMVGQTIPVSHTEVPSYWLLSPPIYPSSLLVDGPTTRYQLCVTCSLRAR